MLQAQKILMRESMLKMQYKNIHVLSPKVKDPVLEYMHVAKPQPPLASSKH